MDRRIEELVSGSKSFFNIPSIEIEKTISSKKTIPTSLDWRDKGVITPVYNQGTSPKYSTVVAVEAIESFQAIRGGKLEKGSIDQVSDCCENTIDILDCILNKMGGSLCRESDYKSSNITCDRNACQPFAVFNNLKVLKVANEYTMLEWIQDSPLYVGVNAADFGFEIYKSGVYSNPECANGTVDHVLQIVGYGIESGTPYWLCKNSWSSAWGDQGYIRLERGKNTCRIADYVAQVEYRTNDAFPIISYVFTMIYLFADYLGFTTFCKTITIILSFIAFTKPFTFQYLWSGVIVVFGIYLNAHGQNKKSIETYTRFIDNHSLMKFRRQSSNY
ncbi:unnamed protein product [Rotaria sp. Silwood2]|nr:unnamed protein product [Rotaria sp. Silwood2]